MKTAVIITLVVAIPVIITAVNLKALADSVSEFDLWWEDDMYDE